MRRVTSSDIPLDQADRLGGPVIQVYALNSAGHRYPSRVFPGHGRTPVGMVTRRRELLDPRQGQG